MMLLRQLLPSFRWEGVELSAPFELEHLKPPRTGEGWKHPAPGHLLVAGPRYASEAPPATSLALPNRRRFDWSSILCFTQADRMQWQKVCAFRFTAWDSAGLHATGAPFCNTTSAAWPLFCRM